MIDTRLPGVGAVESSALPPAQRGITVRLLMTRPQRGQRGEDHEGSLARELSAVCEGDGEYERCPNDREVHCARADRNQ